MLMYHSYYLILSWVWEKNDCKSDYPARLQQIERTGTSNKQRSHDSKCEVKSAMLMTFKVWNKSALKRIVTKVLCTLVTSTPAESHCYQKVKFALKQQALQHPVQKEHLSIQLLEIVLTILFMMIWCRAPN